MPRIGDNELKRHRVIIILTLIKPTLVPTDKCAMLFTLLMDIFMVNFPAINCVFCFHRSNVWTLLNTERYAD